MVTNKTAILQDKKTVKLFENYKSYLHLYKNLIASKFTFQIRINYHW